MSTLIQDLRFALRQLRRSPGFALVAFSTIALGIGLTTSVFSFVNALLFSPLPGVAAPDELTVVYTDEGGGPGVSSYMDYVDFREGLPAFSRLAAFKPRDADVATPDGTVRVRALMVSENYFRTLGVMPEAGRFFLPDEDARPDAVAVAVLSDAFADASFGDAAASVGQTISLNRRAFTIVGVVGGGFRGTNLADAPDVFVPMAMQPHLMPSSGLLLNRRGWGGIDIVGRLAPGVDRRRAESELAVVGERLRTAYPGTNGERTYRLASFRDATMPVGVRPRIARLGGLLIGLVLLVLVVACVNVANLLLARSGARRREMAVRRTLGAGRARLVRQLLTESVLLAGLGGAAGLAIANWANALLGTIPLPFDVSFGIDANVLLFAVAATIFTGLAFGLAPAVGAARRKVVWGLRDGDPRASGKRPLLRAGDALVVAQVGLSVTVLVAAGLFGRTFLNLRLLDPGFDSARVLTARLDPSLQGYDGQRIRNYYDDVLEAVAALPGVDDVALSSRLPGPDADQVFVRIRGYESPEAGGVPIEFSMESTDFFATLGIPIRRGRGFAETDRPGDPPVLVISEAAARFITDRTGADALDAELSVEGPNGPFFGIAGIAADVRSGPPREAPVPHLYVHLDQVPPGDAFASLALLVRTAGDPAALAGSVRSAVAGVDPDVPLLSVRTLDAHLGDGRVQERLAATILAIGGVLTLILASLGLYGVLAGAVTRRTAEIGVRMALGAAGGSVLRDVLARGLSLTGLGVALGLVGAIAVGRALTAFLYGVSPIDVTTLALVVATLAAVALVASWAPARRATRIDPVRALRNE